MKLAGYTIGQMLAIGTIALVFIFLAKEVNNRVQIPGLHRIVEGS